MTAMKGRPAKSKFLMTPEQIRARAAQQKASADPETQKLGVLGESLATAIERQMLMNSGLFDNPFFNGKAPWGKYKI